MRCVRGLGYGCEQEARETRTLFGLGPLDARLIEDQLVKSENAELRSRSGSLTYLGGRPRSTSVQQLLRKTETLPEEWLDIEIWRRD